MTTAEKWAFFFASFGLGALFSAALMVVAGDKAGAMNGLWIVGGVALIAAVTALAPDDA